MDNPSPPRPELQPIGEKHLSDGTTNYDYLAYGRWWDKKQTWLEKGWVRNERFGSGQVIPGTNRAAQRRKS